ncbi:aryl-sulfate sulfotransferase [Burkholderia cepacia]|uniref:aryl-sulfate sulfotransferase n=1 Tax=Burkholderia cepacia TaxID=292 RepID=UPI001576FD82|nr:aryl-sulfate sulfotransferase [Burkholderia cepacia]NTX21301.1 aryl-sulfate sulfotransferase [Burkholderia cepacia]
MQTKKLRLIAGTRIAAALSSVVLASHAIAFPSVFPTGVTKYMPDKAYNTYVIYDGRDGKTHLIDMNGNEVHTWNYTGFPSEIIDPALINGQKGHAFLQVSSTDLGAMHGTSAGAFHNKEIGEVDWDGKVVWRWGTQAPSGEAAQNHDWIKLPGGNVISLSTIRHAVPGFKNPKQAEQVLYEINPEGKIVWKWVASEHLKEMGFDDKAIELIQSGYSNSGSSAGFLMINNVRRVGENKWFDGGDKRFAPDNLIFDSREGNVIGIIDKQTGKVVWHMGPTYDEKGRHPMARILGDEKLPRPVDQISGQHDVHLIPKGLPGAGNLLVFDNQGPAGFPQVRSAMVRGSRVLEIDPIKQEIVWQYRGTDSGRDAWTFDSAFISSARRLPNGNTLIDEGMNGRFFQITPQGEIVWEYVSPNFADEPMAGKVVKANWAFRATPVPYDWVPDGTPHEEDPVTPPENSAFRIPVNKR